MRLIHCFRLIRLPNRIKPLHCARKVTYVNVLIVQAYVVGYCVGDLDNVFGGPLSAMHVGHDFIRPTPPWRMVSVCWFVCLSVC